ncbi:MAG TPA: PglZ domain-containing protein, partial [Gemmatimonadaceae bacterium]
MRNPLRDYIAKQLAEKLRSRRVVVWYDEHEEFRLFIDELRGGAGGVEPLPVSVDDVDARVAEYAGSMFELRDAVEPHVSGDAPAPLVLYIPGCERDPKGSVLMELEKAGTLWQHGLRDVARNVLLRKYTLGVVDELLPFDRRLVYEDVARMAAASDRAEPPSILKSIFHETPHNDDLLAAWLVSDARDEEIVAKGATRELTRLATARLGLLLPEEAPLTKLRAITSRYVLAGEFRLDLSCDPPPSVDAVPRPASEDQESAIRELARRLRRIDPDAYAALADRLEEELGLGTGRLPPGCLGAIDTFRFEERELLRHAGDLIADGSFADALKLVTEREQSFWLDRDVTRRAHWEATRRMAELGQVAREVRTSAGAMTGDAAAWLNAYVRSDGWYRLDRAQRRLEAWVTNLDEEPDERALGIVRRAYDDACRTMAEGFTKALAGAGWTIAGALHQTRIFSEVVADRPRPVAYFLVDAMRFEMGVELAERLPKTSEVSVRAAVASLPSITPVGMAALMPGAAASFSVVEQGGKLGARIEDTFLPDLASRRKFAAARVPQLVDLALDELLGLQPSKLAKRIGGAAVVIVRSQEIDHAGEAGFTFQARQVMDTVIDNLARAIRKLAAAGVEHAVLSADHGHLFFPGDRDESMRTNEPGGKRVELHRRCWIGRGGSTPPGCVRVSASALGYKSDLELVFPAGAGVFRAGGD